MNTNNTPHTVGHVGWSPDYKSTPKLPAIGEFIARRSAAACSPSLLTPETDKKIKRICGNWNNAGDRVQEFVLADFARQMERERNEARAMARDQRNQLEKDSRVRLIFPWENSELCRPDNE